MTRFHDPFLQPMRNFCGPFPALMKSTIHSVVVGESNPFFFPGHSLSETNPILLFSFTFPLGSVSYAKRELFFLFPDCPGLALAALSLHFHGSEFVILFFVPTTSSSPSPLSIIFFHWDFYSFPKKGIFFPFFLVPCLCCYDPVTRCSSRSRGSG